MSAPAVVLPEVVLHSLPSRVTEDLAIQDRWKLALLGGAPLPAGMAGSLTIEARRDGSVAAHVMMQGLSKHGRRYSTRYGVNAGIEAQAALLAWARRILRKRAAAGGL